MQQQHPFSEEAWSLPANGGTKFRQNHAVRSRRNGVATLLEFGERALIQKRRSQLGFVTYLLNYLRIYTGCPRRNVEYFGRVFLMLNYTDIPQNTYIQS